MVKHTKVQVHNTTVFENYHSSIKLPICHLYKLLLSAHILMCVRVHVQVRMFVCDHVRKQGEQSGGTVD